MGSSILNSLRIIGGEWRRRILRFPASSTLRPTPDRVRETLFNWLGQDLTGRCCLDLFAGSGALGFEAASRGAEVVMVDHSPRILAALAVSAQALGAGPRVRIVHSDAVRFLSSAAARFDVLFLDPPFHDAWMDRLAPLLPRVLAEDGAIYAEAEKFLAGLGSWRTVRHGRAGQVFYHLLRRGETDGTE